MTMILAFSDHEETEVLKFWCFSWTCLSKKCLRANVLSQYRHCRMMGKCVIKWRTELPSLSFALHSKGPCLKRQMVDVGSLFLLLNRCIPFLSRRWSSNAFREMNVARQESTVHWTWTSLRGEPSGPMIWKGNFFGKTMDASQTERRDFRPVQPGFWSISKARSYGNENRKQPEISSRSRGYQSKAEKDIRRVIVL